jgi:hypothetical protein
VSILGDVILVLGLVVIFLTPALAITSIKFKVFPFLRNTYIFWAVFSLYNFDLLAGLAIPPLMIVGITFYAKFAPFLLPPFAFALTVSSAAIAFVNRAFPQFRASRLGKEVCPIAFNLFFLTAFLPAAEYYKNVLIAQVLESHKPDCVQIGSFIKSLSHGGHNNSFSEHALFTENGKTFFWSYSKRDFFEGKEELSRNFPCRSAM